MRGCTHIYSSVFAVVLVEYSSFHRRDATRIAAKVCFSCRHLLAASPAAKRASQGCSASSAKSSRMCQWDLPGGDGQDLPSHICLMLPEQPAQLTRDNMAVANKFSASSTSLYRTAGRGSWENNLGACSPTNSCGEGSRNRSVSATCPKCGSERRLEASESDSQGDEWAAWE